MDRMACVRVPGIALQYLRRRIHIDEHVPLVVIDAERPSGRILERNRAAAALGVRVGMRHAQALSCSAAVRAGVVRDDERQALRDHFLGVLQAWSPAVEPSPHEEGVFWLDARGLGRLFASEEAWRRAVANALSADGWVARVACGWSRAGTAIATAEGGDVTARTASQEREWMTGRSIDLLPLAGRDRELLALLGIRSVGAFMRLPGAELPTRISVHAREIHRYVCDDDRLPIQQRDVPRTLVVVHRPDPVIRMRDQLVSVVPHMVARLVRDAREQGRYIHALTLTLHDEDGRSHRERLSSGVPTRDAAFLQRMVQLRSEHADWQLASIEEVVLEAESSQVAALQGTLALDTAPDGDRPTRPSDQQTVDLPRLERALTLVRAELGVEAVRTLRSRDAQLPEAAYDEPLLVSAAVLVAARASPSDARSGADPEVASIARVRRIIAGGAARPRPLSGATWGPFLISSFWWSGAAIERHYEYQAAPGGWLLWSFRERGRREWRLQGRVE